MIRFIHIPKTGGAAVREYLLKNNIPHKFGSRKKDNVYAKKHRYASYWLEKYPQEDNFFCVVRNPYTRLASYYRYLQKHEHLDRDISWNTFVENKIDFHNHFPWDLQINWIYDFTHKEQLVKHVFRMENLEEEVNNFFSLSIPMEKVNVTNDQKLDYFETYYSDPKITKIVTEHFAKDFEYLNYKVI